MERVDEVFVLSAISGAFQVDFHFKKLGTLRAENDPLLKFAQVHRLDSRVAESRHHVGLILRVTCLVLRLVEGKTGHAHIGVLGVIRLFIHKDLSIVAAHNETSHVGADATDVEAFNGVLLMEHQFKTAVILTDKNVALIRSNEDLVVGQPAMRRVVAGDMLLFFLHAVGRNFEVNVLVELEVLVSVRACDEDLLVV
jgi:hypothetical protein